MLTFPYLPESLMGFFFPIVLQRGEEAMPVQRADYCLPSWNGLALISLCTDQ